MKRQSSYLDQISSFLQSCAATRLLLSSILCVAAGSLGLKMYYLAISLPTLKPAAELNCVYGARILGTHEGIQTA